MSAARIREAAEVMRREDTPFFDALSDLFIDVAVDVEQGVTPENHNTVTQTLRAAENYLDAYLNWPASVAPIEVVADDLTTTTERTD